MKKKVTLGVRNIASPINHLTSEDDEEQEYLLSKKDAAITTNFDESPLNPLAPIIENPISTESGHGQEQGNENVIIQWNLEASQMLDFPKGGLKPKVPAKKKAPGSQFHLSIQSNKVSHRYSESHSSLMKSTSPSQLRASQHSFNPYNQSKLSSQRHLRYGSQPTQPTGQSATSFYSSANGKLMGPKSRGGRKGVGKSSSNIEVSEVDLEKHPYTFKHHVEHLESGIQSKEREAIQKQRSAQVKISKLRSALNEHISKNQDQEELTDRNGAHLIRLHNLSAINSLARSRGSHNPKLPSFKSFSKKKSVEHGGSSTGGGPSERSVTNPKLIANQGIDLQTSSMFQPRIVISRKKGPAMAERSVSVSQRQGVKTQQQELRLVINRSTGGTRPAKKPLFTRRESDWQNLQSFCSFYADNRNPIKVERKTRNEPVSLAPFPIPEKYSSLVDQNQDLLKLNLVKNTMTNQSPVGGASVGFGASAIHSSSINSARPASQSRIRPNEESYLTPFTRLKIQQKKEKEEKEKAIRHKTPLLLEFRNDSKQQPELQKTHLKTASTPSQNQRAIETWINSKIASKPVLEVPQPLVEPKPKVHKGSTSPYRLESSKNMEIQPLRYLQGSSIQPEKKEVRHSPNYQPRKSSQKHSFQNTSVSNASRPGTSTQNFELTGIGETLQNSGTAIHNVLSNLNNFLAFQKQQLADRQEKFLRKQKEDEVTQAKTKQANYKNQQFFQLSKKRMSFFPKAARKNQDIEHATGDYMNGGSLSPPEMPNNGNRSVPSPTRFPAKSMPSSITIRQKEIIDPAQMLMGKLII